MGEARDLYAKMAAKSLQDWPSDERNFT